MFWNVKKTILMWKEIIFDISHTFFTWNKYHTYNSNIYIEKNIGIRNPAPKLRIPDSDSNDEKPADSGFRIPDSDSDCHPWKKPPPKLHNTRIFSRTLTATFKQMTIPSSIGTANSHFPLVSCSHPSVVKTNHHNHIKLLF